MRERRANSSVDRTRSESSTNNFALSVASAKRKSRSASPSGQAHLIHLVDALIGQYVIWQGECAAAARSYENWSNADSDDEALTLEAGAQDNL